MPRTKQSRGQCVYCGQIVAKSGAFRHLESCPKRLAFAVEANEKGGKPETLWHIRAQDAYDSSFWLELEMRGDSTLNDLDKYLRAIWLECCGHLSKLSIGEWGREIGKKRKAGEVFAEGIELTHTYDFGTSSYTLIKPIAYRQGAPTTKKPIALMMRNLQPEAECIECGEPAEWLCRECLIEDEWGTLCSEHRETHPHGDNYGEPIPLVNSPRLGMCGYDGPADPPY